MGASTGNLAGLTHADMVALEAGVHTDTDYDVMGYYDVTADNLGITDADIAAAMGNIAGDAFMSDVVKSGVGSGSVADTEKAISKAVAAPEKESTDILSIAKAILSPRADRTSPFFPAGFMANSIVDALQAIGFKNAYIDKDTTPPNPGFSKVWHEGESGAPADTWYGWDENDPRIHGWWNGIPYGSGAPTEWFTDPSWSPGEGAPGGSSDNIYNPRSDPPPVTSTQSSPPPAQDVTSIPHFNPSSTYNRSQWYHPILDTAYTPGERPSYIRPNIWTYTPPPFRDWTSDLRG